MSLWIMVSKDEYELPIAVANTADELAKMTGVSANVIRCQTSRRKSGKVKKTQFIKIEDEEEKDEHL